MIKQTKKCGKGIDPTQIYSDLDPLDFIQPLTISTHIEQAQVLAEELEPSEKLEELQDLLEKARSLVEGVEK